ncbi:dof zinc finger protein DOF3.4-like [Punica granatum]|uniref:Dof zinc finger protein n=2 Tax=Punica granatum TaxID=22663 RepID=A0A218W204_PUNGR|nr:dof zinc finger protein DOF3.4-like [Punica granatum]OWM66291.1 hypothetical protein CDL15_Pgr013508 [Punica granatum]PKI51609.1 hypothetical protein CRG98_027975 [Punica granatum]
MPSDCADRQRPARQHGQQAAAGAPYPPPEQQEQLPCPRCDSTNTKFCYYNNYNFSQPRHFCKSCRRYWTRGGTLRDIPVGGGTRKNSKRSRTTSAATASAAPVLPPLDGSVAIHGSVQSGEAMRPAGGSFTSLLTTQGPAAGFLALGGLGLGLEDHMAFGLGRGATWAYPGVADGGSAIAGSDHAGVAFGMAGSTWQLDSGVEVGGDCFSWPELAISTPGNGA